MADLSAAPPRVLHVIPTLHLGGAERQLRYLCPELARCGFEPHVAHLRGGAHLTPLVRAGVATHRLRARHRNPVLAFEIARLARALRPAVIQTWLPVMDLVAGLVARALRVPWMVSERTLPSAYPGSATMRLRNRWVAHAADAVVANSSAADAWWAARLPVHTRRRMIRNGIALDELDALPPADDHLLFGLDPERPLIVFVGRFDRGKNVDGLVDVLARVLPATPAQALLCGDGPLLEHVRGRIAREGLAADVVAPGFVTLAPALVKRAAVFLSLSRYEGMPNAVMEAAALGCPVVLSDIPAHRELLDDEAAVFVPAEAVEPAAEGVLGCLRNPAAARERAARARARAQNWSIPAAAQAYADLYADLLRAHAR